MDSELPHIAFLARSLAQCGDRVQPHALELAMVVGSRQRCRLSREATGPCIARTASALGREAAAGFAEIVGMAVSYTSIVPEPSERHVHSPNSGTPGVHSSASANLMKLS